MRRLIQAHYPQCLFLAGCLGLGFLSVFFGFLLLLPPFRAVAYRWLKARVKVQSFSTGPQQSQGYQRSDVIDGDFTEVSQQNNENQPPSGWTRH